MKRSIGVTLSAVVTILGSVLTALFGVLMLVSFRVSRGGGPDVPPYARVAAVVMAGVLFALTAWGVTTAIGLIRLRPLSRVLTIGFFAFGALNGLSFALLPGSAARMMQAMANLPASMRQPTPADFPLPLVPIAVTMVITCGVPIWFLVRRRSAFVKAPPAAQ